MDRIGLAYQSSGEWEDAVESFTKSLNLRRSAGIDENNSIILRNIANNLYFLSSSAEKRDPDRLVKALDHYRKSETALLEKEDKPKQKKSGSLISVEVETGLGGVKGASKGFSDKEEMKLIFHHIGKIYGELSDYSKAVEYFERKLTLTPPELPLLENIPVLTEKAIVINQIGYYLAKLGRPKDSVARFDESLEISLKLENRTGILTNADNMTRIALANQETFPPVLLSKVINRGSLAIDKVLNLESDESLPLGTLANHVAQLHHFRFNKQLYAKPTTDPYSSATRIRSMGSDSYQAERLYKIALENFKTDKSATIAKAHAVATINFAQLLADMGQGDEAMKLLGSAEAQAVSLSMPDVLWQARFWMYNLDPKGREDYLGKSANSLDQLPFGYGALDGTRQVFAIVRSIFNDLAEDSYSKGDVESAMAYIENGLNIGIKLALAGLVKSHDVGSIPGLSGLVDIFSRRISIAEPDTAQVGAIDKENALYMDNLKDTNPLLSHIAQPMKLDWEKVSSKLRKNEAAVSVWHREDEAVLFIISPTGYTSAVASSQEDMLEKLKSSDGMKGVDRLFLATDRPFSDPLVASLGTGYLVSTIPSLS